MGLSTNCAAIFAQHEMRSVNVDRVRLRLGAIADALRRLRMLDASGDEAFLADFRNTESAKYLLRRKTIE